jgi:hypothetical protein
MAQSQAPALYQTSRIALNPPRMETDSRTAPEMPVPVGVTFKVVLEAAHGKLARIVCLRAARAVGITFGDQP